MHISSQIIIIKNNNINMCVNNYSIYITFKWRSMANQNIYHKY